MKKGISTKAPRTCRECGVTFDGGPRAWYCPECREERRKIQKERYERRRKEGLSIVLGETVGRCAVCGREFIFASARQMYCPDCSKEAWKEADRHQGMEWYHGHNTEDDRKKRRKRRKENYVRKSPTVCPVCGSKLERSQKSYCSDRCARIAQSYQSARCYYLQGKRKSLPTWEEWVRQEDSRLSRGCKVCGKKIGSMRHSYCSPECSKIGKSYSTALSHYLAGTRSEPPSWEEWIKLHKK